VRLDSHEPLMIFEARTSAGPFPGRSVRDGPLRAKPTARVRWALDDRFGHQRYASVGQSDTVPLERSCSRAGSFGWPDSPKRRWWWSASRAAISRGRDRYRNGRDAAGGSVARRLCRAIGPDPPSGRRPGGGGRPNLLTYIGRGSPDWTMVAPCSPASRPSPSGGRQEATSLDAACARRPVGKQVGTEERSHQIEQRSCTKGRKSGWSLTRGIGLQKGSLPEGPRRRRRLGHVAVLGRVIEPDPTEGRGTPKRLCPRESQRVSGGVETSPCRSSCSGQRRSRGLSCFVKSRSFSGGSVCCH